VATTLTLAPDIGLPSTTDTFDSSKNPFVLTALISTFSVASGGEARADVKGPSNFRLTLDSVVYEVPLALRQQLRGKDGGRVFWKTDGSDFGSFRYFRQAPPVFDEQEQQTG
jgi:hypothetical protein